ncbi:hypothetical protein ABZ128_04950 [Streptomyces sp. NPDC006326]|uniref:hypothetical protein n=1 Tax=Streptomyces sp. NPDC006326 TaxID=3156752 RepID=UPI0033A903CB
MTGTGRPRPLLFLDVDGPLIPFGATREQRPYGYPTYGEHSANPLLARIDPSLGPRLSALPCTLVWATTWGDDANEWVGPRARLPELPVVSWAETAEDGDGHVGGPHWKTRTLVERAAGRPFAWVDDEITDADRAWVAGHHPGRALLHRIDPAFGLTDADFTVLDAWLREAGGPDTSPVLAARQRR